MTTTLTVIAVYLIILLVLGLASARFFKGTAGDYFVASRSVGPFLLLMSIFGTTMTAFAMVGSTGEAYVRGIGVYGLMASWSGIVHSAIFFIVGTRLWSAGHRLGIVTQCQYFRRRFDSPLLGACLFPVLVGLVVPYLLIGLLGGERVMAGITRGAFPEAFAATGGALPGWLTSLIICGVVLTYVFFGGLRGAVWANTFQTLLFMSMGVVAFVLIGRQLGGMAAASSRVAEKMPQLLAREGMMGQLEFLTYGLVPLSVGMFPHLFQHWLTARKASTFKLTVVAHPICIMAVWMPCILIGIWAAGAGVSVPAERAGAVLGIMVARLDMPLFTGLIAAGILAAIMSTLDSQFVCLGTMFTEDIVSPLFGRDRISDRQRIWLARTFIVTIILATWLLTLASTGSIFGLGVWCFSGFTALFPLVLAAVLWRRATAAGALSGLFTAVGVWGFLFVRSGYGAHEGLIFGMMPVTPILLCSATAMWLVSLCTRPPEEATLKLFFPARKG